jgi:hypothetical protein
VELPNGWKGESKARAEGFRQIYQWLAGGADFLALRADRQPWLIVLPIERFKELLDDPGDV